MNGGGIRERTPARVAESDADNENDHINQVRVAKMHHDREKSAAAAFLRFFR